ncbi:hypothetical protein [Tabrizicola sp.]|uniref:hypothetical protein n=1 Tax=Tabrizicola sp. TaxID=2005166 RepID=UPI00273265A8|nr:hypothetical protein [Tabrizicola sp.]MDP3197876.1 hypothetical protein [Tabrizicola sp.]
MKNFLSACSVFVVAASFATSSFAITEEVPDEPDDPIGCLSSECDEPDPPKKPKGNNGWGNGTDEVDGVGGTNAGSDSGGTAVTKSINGKGIDKFEGKFDGR